MTKEIPWVALVLLLAGLADFSGIHQFQHSDTLIPVFCSLYKWTPYFWGQDRVGMLVPLLATGIHHPLANLLFQMALSWAIGLTGIVLSVRWAMGGQGPWRFSGAIVCVLLILTASPAVNLEFFGIHMGFAQALAFGFAGLLTLQRPLRRPSPAIAGAALCFSLALWVNISVAAILVALAVLSKSNRKACLSAVGVSLVIGGLLTRTSPYHATSFHICPPWDWPRAYVYFARQVFPQLLAAPVLLCASFGAALLSRTIFKNKTPPLPWRAFFLLNALGLIHFFAAGATQWVASQHYAWRYAFPTIYLFYISAALLGFGPCFALFERKASPPLGTILLCLCGLIGVSIRLGPPSFHAPERALYSVHGRTTADLIQAEATHFEGNYWKIWPAVFLVTLEYYKKGSSRFLWPVAFRASPLVPEWESMDRRRFRVAILKEDPDTIPVLKAFHFFSLRRSENYSTLQILVAAENRAQ